MDKAQRILLIQESVRKVKLDELAFLAPLAAAAAPVISAAAPTVARMAAGAVAKKAVSTIGSALTKPKQQEPVDETFALYALKNPRSAAKWGGTALQVTGALTAQPEISAIGTAAKTISPMLPETGPLSRQKTPVNEDLKSVALGVGKQVALASLKKGKEVLTKPRRTELVQGAGGIGHAVQSEQYQNYRLNKINETIGIFPGSPAEGLRKKFKSPSISLMKNIGPDALKMDVAENYQLKKKLIEASAPPPPPPPPPRTTAIVKRTETPPNWTFGGDRPQPPQQETAPKIEDGVRKFIGWHLQNVGKNPVITKAKEKIKSIFDSGAQHLRASPILRTLGVPIPSADTVKQKAKDVAGAVSHAAFETGKTVGPLALEIGGKTGKTILNVAKRHPHLATGILTTIATANPLKGIFAYFASRFSENSPSAQKYREVGRDFAERMAEHLRSKGKTPKPSGGEYVPPSPEEVDIEGPPDESKALPRPKPPIPMPPVDYPKLPHLPPEPKKPTPTPPPPPPKKPKPPKDTSGQGTFGW